MAPPPEYDKEPKAPDKTAPVIINEDTKLINSLNDQQTKSDHKTTNTATNSEGEKSKADNSVENLDDGRLRALLDEAITYKCPKDREGKSDLFKNLLEEAEQDDQASEAVARASSGGARVRRGAGRRALAHSNSLQDLVAAALAAEPAPRRPRPHASVSARATHGGSLPSGVDTSFLLGEEPTRAGYLATVRCVNPPPFAERRVSASDANCPAEIELLHRRSKPVFPVTYTARATLEIGSGSVSSGRAVTTTTASNQVRTPAPALPNRNQTRLMNALHRPTDSQVVKRFECEPRGPRLQHDIDMFRISWTDITARYAPEKETQEALELTSQKHSTGIGTALLGLEHDKKTATTSKKRETSAQNMSTGNTTAIHTRKSCLEQDKKTATTSEKRETFAQIASPGNATAIITRKSSLEQDQKTKLISDKRKTVTQNPSPGNVTAILTRKSSLEQDKKTAMTSERKTPRDKKANARPCQTGPSHENNISASFRQTQLHDSKIKPLPVLQKQQLPENKTTSQPRGTTQLLIENKMTTQPMRQTNLLLENKMTVQPMRQTNALCENKMTAQPKLEESPYSKMQNMTTNSQTKLHNDMWLHGVNKWYEGLDAYAATNKCLNKIPTQHELNFLEINDDNSSVIAITEGMQNNDIARTNVISDINIHSTSREPQETEKMIGRSDDNITRANENLRDDEECDIILRKKYRERVGRSLTVPNLTSINPRNIRPMTIGTIPSPVNGPSISVKDKDDVNFLENNNVKNISIVNKVNEQTKTEQCDSTKDMVVSNAAKYLPKRDSIKIITNINKNDKKIEDCSPIKFELRTQKQIGNSECSSKKEQCVTLNKPEKKPDTCDGIELVEISQCDKNVKMDSFSQYYSKQKKIFEMLKETENENCCLTELKDMVSDQQCKSKNSFEQYNFEQQNLLKLLKHQDCEVYEEVNECNQQEDADVDNNVANSEKLTSSTTNINKDKTSSIDRTSNDIIIKLNTQHKKPDDEDSRDHLILAELQHNAYVFLTMPNRFFQTNNIDKKSVHIREIQNDVSENREVRSAPKNSKRGKDKTVGLSEAKKRENINRTALKVLLFEKNKRDSIKAEASSEANKEVDSAIPFSCITTPEVVSSCNTTSSTSQTAVAVDPKPRSVISSSFNGLSLSRPNYGSTASTAPDEYKVPIFTVHYRLQKSLDENGNAVQGFSSPISGSSQHKKPRRKKSSKNETVITSHQIDGYQGNKDINEVLRFIESNAEHGRGAKLGRAKHKDDSDDKSGKKRSSERRKDKESKVKRASSLEELSRTKLEDLTDAREPPRRHDRKPRPDNKAERRSWGDDARDSFYYPAPASAPEPDAEREPDHDHEPDPEPEPPALVDVAPEPATELTDFQTVTKRRKPRRRADDTEREPPRRPRPPSPRARRESAPPSDRSNDSNDDLDSVHSLPPPPPPPPPAPHASYADIARTRHNIPDLIESCNFYAEGESATVRRAVDAPATAGDADGYPALGGGGGGGGAGCGRGARGKPAARRERKERAPAAPPAPDCPAPDVLGDRRPAVILLDSAARPRDMDGVTFGFDINEQLLGAGARRPRCDLVRDALDAGAAAAASTATEGEAEAVTESVTAGSARVGVAVAVVAGCTALRYVPPDPPPDTHHLHQIIDYVGNAWEDVVRCGAGKIRYFSE
ncbi:unnamed protein product [Chilo suppressalis]|uniref:Uncharacterized protein n=1 Tax=Chilo suppressalis TaxID=168631 RepID=A0ABN8L991_CHISP|nr:unnamed protein product [Chilo suppressalis]